MRETGGLMGIYRAGWDDDAVLVGLVDLSEPGELSRDRNLQRRREGRVSKKDHAC
jgi:hypothetical protein